MDEALLTIERPHARASLTELGIATLTIISENHLNILGTPVVEDLIEVLHELKDDHRIRALILRGQGEKAFVAGANIKEMAKLDRAGAEMFIGKLAQLCHAVHHFPAPVIARIPGWCLGAGLELALVCDLKIASASSQFGMPEVKVGIPSVIHAALMPRLMPACHAHWMLLTGETIDSETALAWGLVNERVQDSALDTRIAQTAMMFAHLPPLAVRQQKRLLRRWETLPLKFDIAYALHKPHGSQDRLAV
jgi:enoyl-CoA hydratase